MKFQRTVSAYGIINVDGSEYFLGGVAPGDIVTVEKQDDQIIVKTLKGASVNVYGRITR